MVIMLTVLRVAIRVIPNIAVIPIIAVILSFLWVSLDVDSF